MDISTHDILEVPLIFYRIWCSKVVRISTTSGHQFLGITSNFFYNFFIYTGHYTSYSRSWGLIILLAFPIDELETEYSV